MISGEKIAQYIAEPQSIDTNELGALEELVNKYPYASSFHLLELKGLAIANSIDFEDKLKSTAIHAPDRAHLYRFIHSGESHATEEIVTEETPTVITADIEPKNDTIEVAEQAVAEQEELSLSNSNDKTTEESVIENKSAVSDLEISAKNKVESQPEKESDINPVADAEAIEESADRIESISSELDLDIINKAIDVAYVSSEIGEDEIIDTTKQNTPIQEDAPLSSAKEEIVIEEQEAEIDTSNFTFIEWLRYKQNHPSEGKKQTTAEAKTANEKQESSPIKEEVEEVEQEKQPQKAVKKQNDIDALLDKFMQEEPRISKPVKDFYSPTKNAQKSIEEPDDMVSETLAKIHVLQKNYSKAISAYEKLMLLYPEKKLFFASQIEKIKEESKKR